MSVERHFTGSPFEKDVGFCRAIRSGDRILVAGTVGTDETGAAPEGVYAQLIVALRRVQTAVEALGGQMSDVVRTRIYALDPIGAFDDVARAHRETFAGHPPVTSLLGVTAFVAEPFLVEVEAEAIVGAGSG